MLSLVKSDSNMRHLLVTYPYTEVMTFSLWKVKINFFESYRYSELLKWNNTVTCVITWDKDVSLLKTLLVYTNTHEHFVWDNVNQTLHTINLRVQLVRKGRQPIYQMSDTQRKDNSWLKTWELHETLSITL